LKYLLGIVENHFHYGDSDWHLHFWKPAIEPHCMDVSF